MSNPVEEFLMAKEGAPAVGTLTRASTKAKDIGSRLMEGAATAGVLGVAGAGVAGLSLAASKLYDAATKGRDFRNMMEANPDLAQRHEEDPTSFNRMFSALRTMNPTFSREPTVAGTYMRRMIDSPETAGMVAVEALSERPRPELGPAGEAMVGGFQKGVGEYAKPAKPADPTLIGKLTTREDIPGGGTVSAEWPQYGQPGEKPSFIK